MEFIVVYSFVLLIFIIMFALVTSQRAASLSQQDYAMLQLQAQNVADAIDGAVDAGSGFTSTVSLQGALSSSVPYNLSVSSTGVVIVKEKIGAQVLSAYAFSNARSLIINGTLLPNGNGYLLPTSSGTLRVANSQGTVYIDRMPATTVPLAYTMTLNQLQHVKAASFNGAGNYISVPYSGAFYPTQYVTVSLWFETTEPISGSWSQLLNTAGLGAGCDYGTYCLRAGSSNFYFSVATTSGLNQYTYVSNSALPASQKINTGNWNNVVGVYDGSKVYIYWDGVLQNSATATGTLLQGSTNAITIADPYAAAYQGSISNIQIYNTILTANQIQRLYQNGIGGAPVLTANVVGWWPLNGNANDYGGNGFSGTPTSTVGYNSVVYVQTHVALGSGANAANALVGGIASNGIFTQNSMPSLAAYSNSTGYAKAYITAPNVSSLNFTLFGFNGNGTLTGNLIGWWPLEEGYGSASYDLSGSGDNGVFTNPSWSYLNQTNLAVAHFNGASSYIDVPDSGSLQVEPNPYTVALWVDFSSVGGRQVFLAKAATGIGYAFSYVSGYGLDLTKLGIIDQYVSWTPSTNVWYFIVAVQTANSVSYYVNGNLLGSYSNSNAYVSSAGYVRDTTQPSQPASCASRPTSSSHRRPRRKTRSRPGPARWQFPCRPCIPPPRSPPE